MRRLVFTRGVRRGWLLRWMLVASMLAGCGIPAQPAGAPLATTTVPAAVAPTIPAATPTIVHLSIESADPTSAVSVRVLEPTPTVDALPSVGGVAPDAAPLIFTSVSASQQCGRGDIVAEDGHALYATPALHLDQSNFLERLPIGSQVAILDCRLWTDSDDLNWLAVRTEQGKLGWMLIQADKFYVTLYPVTLDPPASLTGIPADDMVAYVPPSECREGPVSDAAMATSIGIDFIPVVGDIKGLSEAATGCDLVTGERLGNWRWLGLFGLVGLAEVATIRHAGKLSDGLRVANNLDGSLRYGDDAVMLLARNSDTAADFVSGVRKIEHATEGSVDVVRSIEKGAPFSDDAVRSLAMLEQPCSFSANTPVATAAGPTPIRDIQVGQLVLAFNQQTATVGYYPVTATTAHVDLEIIQLAIGQETFETTPEHPFFVDGDWVAAGLLQPGDTVAAAYHMNGSVRSIQRVHRQTTMYNLTVAEAHTFFVGLGGWLVHNACGQKLRRALLNDGLVPDWGADAPWQAHHIIPGQLEREHQFVIDAIGEGNWQIDGVKNGIALPQSEEIALGLCQRSEQLCFAVHRGSHPQYTATVRAELDDLARRADVELWDGARKAQELDKLTDRLRQTFKKKPGERLR